MAERRPIVITSTNVLGELPAGDTLPGAFPEAPIDGQQYARKDAAWEVVTGGGGGSVPSPPTGALDMVFGIDELGVPGWVPKYKYLGATLWPAKDSNRGTIEPTFGYSNLIFDDAEEYGLYFFDPSGTAIMRERAYIPQDGLYVVSFSVSFPTGSTGVYRARVFLNGDPVVMNLIGRTSPYFTGAGSADTSGVSAPLRLRAGDYLTLGLLPAMNVMIAARSSWFNIEKVQ